MWVKSESDRRTTHRTDQVSLRNSENKSVLSNLQNSVSVGWRDCGREGSPSERWCAKGIFSATVQSSQPSAMDQLNTAQSGPLSVSQYSESPSEVSVELAGEWLGGRVKFMLCIEVLKQEMKIDLFLVLALRIDTENSGAEN